MKILPLLACMFLSAAPCAGCAGQSAATVLSEAENGVTAAGITLQIVSDAAASYFAANPNPKLQKEVFAAIADTSNLLQAAEEAMSGAKSIEDGDVQAALASFSTSFTSLMQLVSQIGIQTAPAGAPAVRVGGKLFVASPRILRLLHAPAAAAAP